MTPITANLKTYRIFIAMKHRCNDKSDANYGGRGIFVCEAWTSFEQFLLDMGPQPRGLVLDRKDNDGPYSPENCRWVTPKVSARNTRRNRFVTAFGLTACVSEWAEKTGINKITIIQRLNKGWTPEAALSISTGSKRHSAPSQLAPLMRQAGLA